MTEIITTLFIGKSRATDGTIERTTKTTNEFKRFSNKRGSNVNVINTKIIPYDIKLIQSSKNMEIILSWLFL